MSKPNQRRLAGDIPPLRPADIVPFPQVKRVHFVEKPSDAANDNLIGVRDLKDTRILEFISRRRH